MTAEERAGAMRVVLLHGCGDNSCQFSKRQGGMGTNGGCRCREFIAEALEAHAKEAVMAALDKAALALDDSGRREREVFTHLGAHSPYLEGRIKQAGKDAAAIRAMVPK